MELIESTTSSKIYKLCDKVYKFNKQTTPARFLNEMLYYNKMSSLEIPNIMEYLNIDEDIKMIEMKYYPYVLEKYFENAYPFSITKRKKNEIIYNLVNTMKNLHDNNLYHGDYKAKNILMDYNMNVKISDFNLSSGNQEDKGGDLRKLNLLIYQILYEVKYDKELYNNYESIFSKIEKDYGSLSINMRNHNLKEIMNYFK